MSTIYVNNINERTTGNGTDVNNFRAQGAVINSGTYNTGYGSGAMINTTSTSWQTLRINGTSQAVHGSITKKSADALNFNKISGNSHLIISINFPTYNNVGGSGHGCRLQGAYDDTNYALQDISSEGPAHGWGFHGYGGATAAMNNFTWCTADNPTYASNWLTATGNVAFYFQVKNWSSGDTIWYITYDTTSYPKYATVQVYEVEA